MNAIPDRLGATSEIAEGDRVVLDTSAVIAYLNGDEAVSASARFVIDELVATERNPAVISAVTVGELLVRPMTRGSADVAALTAFLLGFPGITIRAADFLVAAEAARIRAATRANLPDSLVAATAVLTSSRWLVTNDRQLTVRLAGLDWPARVVLLDEVTSTI